VGCLFFCGRYVGCLFLFIFVFVLFCFDFIFIFIFLFLFFLRIIENTLTLKGLSVKREAYLV
jgi:hypothetical protein